ncbi:MAG: hypothetical protein SFY32_16745 [Bacteroidota bacterium]|nr:hypothetical protein [Bacteroidota bacterium]
MIKEEVQNIVSTLITNGFEIDQMERFPKGNIIFNILKLDKLGAVVKYSILFTKDKNETSLTDSVITFSKSFESKPLIVADSFVSPYCTTHTFQKFYDFFGGIVNTGLILIPNLPDILEELGLNKLPLVLHGDAFDLHELYIKECFQFILQSPTRRYGKDRLFESIPDGIVICKNGMMILYDSKAYSNGFDFKADDIKRFAAYVEEFNKRYSAVLGKVFTFIVVTGKINPSEKAIAKRSNELYQKCNTNLSCITSRELGKIVQLLQIEPDIRISILWKNVFSELIIDEAIVQKEITRIKKDNLN